MSGSPTHADAIDQIAADLPQRSATSERDKKLPKSVADDQAACVLGVRVIGGPRHGNSYLASHWRTISASRDYVHSYLCVRCSIAGSNILTPTRGRSGEHQGSLFTAEYWQSNWAQQHLVRPTTRAVFVWSPSRASFTPTCTEEPLRQSNNWRISCEMARRLNAEPATSTPR